MEENIPKAIHVRGGASGGRIVATDIPDSIRNTPERITGRFI